MERRVLLLKALSQESARKLPNFLNQEMSNSAWAFAKLTEMSTDLRSALEAEVQRRMASLDAQALANLSDSVETCAPQLMARLEPFLEDFVGGLPRLAERNSGFSEVLQRVGVDNFGIAGTRALLAKMGIPEPGKDFLQRALRRVQQTLDEGDARKDLWGLAHKRVLCYGEW
ncbi:unnamed protein product, partial [Effrenium voratum]